MKLPDALLSHIIKHYLVLPSPVYEVFLSVCRKWRRLARRDHWLQAVRWWPSRNNESDVRFCTHLTVDQSGVRPRSTHVHTLIWNGLDSPQIHAPLRCLWLTCKSGSGMESWSPFSGLQSLFLRTAQDEETLFGLRHLENLRHFMIKTLMTLQTFDWFPQSAPTLELLQLSRFEPRNLHFLTTLTALRMLKLNYRNIQTPLPDLPHLEELWLCHGQMDKYHIPSGLQKLILHDTSTSAEELSTLNLHSLETVKHRSVLQSSALLGMRNLRHLRVHQITPSLRDLSQLTSLDLSFTGIINDFGWVSKLTALRVLDLRTCDVFEPPFPSHPTLEVFGWPFRESPDVFGWLRIGKSWPRLQTMILFSWRLPRAIPPGLHVVQHFCHAQNSFAYQKAKNCLECR